MHPEINSSDLHYTPIGFKSLGLFILVIIMSNLHEIGQFFGLIGSIIGVLGGIVVLGLNLDRWYNFRKNLKKKE